MELSEEAIQRFYRTLVEIIEDRYDVKIEYRVVNKGEEKNEKKENKQKGN